MKKETTPAQPDKAADRSKATKPIPGFPHPPSEDSIIRNGSAGAFEATENILDEYDSDEDDDDRERDKSHY